MLVLSRAICPPNRATVATAHLASRRLRQQPNAAGTDCVHYFHAGPAIAAALVGAEFANGARVLLYQHEGGNYCNFGPLRRMGD